MLRAARPPFVAAFVLVFFSPVLRAGDGAVAKQLEASGGKVTVKDGVVTEVFFKDCSKLGDAEFRAIGSLVHLKVLTLYGQCHGLTDGTAAHLAGLKELESLGTDGAQFSDDGLKVLTMMTALRSASFFHTSFGVKGFTGTGFGWLKACPHLERLTVAGISMGDEGFAAIATIRQLRELRTWHTHQTEAGNGHIAKLPDLRRIRLGQRLPHAGAKAPSLSDDSLRTLATMKSLESVELAEAHFTVDALLQLRALPKLAKLSLEETDLTEGDVAKLRGAFAGVAIDWKPLTEDQRKKFESYLPK